MTTNINHISSLSLADQERDPEGFAQAFGASFRSFGFAVVTDHGIDPKLIDTAWKATRQLFELPEEAKRRYYSAELAGQRGYTPFGTEIAIGDLRVERGTKDHVTSRPWLRGLAGHLR